MIDRALRHVACVIKWGTILFLTSLGLSLLAGAIRGWYILLATGQDPMNCTGIICFMSGFGVITSIVGVFILFLVVAIWAWDNSSC